MGNLPLMYGKPGRKIPRRAKSASSQAACCRYAPTCSGQLLPVAVTYCLLERIISLSEMFGLR